MAASVTVHHSAFGSERIMRLAELAGYNVHEARGRMALLWSVCTELQTDGVLTAARVRACIGDQGDAHLVEAELAERLENGDIRVKGCTGRIEWFGDQQDGRSAGGKSRAAGAPRDAKGRLLPRSLQQIQVDSSSNQLSESDQDSLSGSDPTCPELPDPTGDRDREGPAATNAPQLELVPEPPTKPIDLALEKPGPTHTNSRADLRRRLFGEAWQYAANKYFELKAAGIDPDARNAWGGLPGANAFEARELFKRIDELLAGDPPNYKHAREELTNRVDVAAAEARFKVHHPISRSMISTRSSTAPCSRRCATSRRRTRRSTS
jgi:hypothetical protein